MLSPPACETGRRATVAWLHSRRDETSLRTLGPRRKPSISEDCGADLSQHEILTTPYRTEQSVRVLRTGAVSRVPRPVLPYIRTRTACILPSHMRISIMDCMEYGVRSTRNAMIATVLQAIRHPRRGANRIVRPVSIYGRRIEAACDPAVSRGQEAAPAEDVRSTSTRDSCWYKIHVKLKVLRHNIVLEPAPITRGCVRC